MVASIDAAGDAIAEELAHKPQVKNQDGIDAKSAAHLALRLTSMMTGQCTIARIES